MKPTKKEHVKTESMFIFLSSLLSGPAQGFGLLKALFLKLAAISRPTFQHLPCTFLTLNIGVCGLFRNSLIAHYGRRRNRLCQGVPTAAERVTTYGSACDEARAHHDTATFWRLRRGCLKVLAEKKKNQTNPKAESVEKKESHRGASSPTDWRI